MKKYLIAIICFLIGVSIPPLLPDRGTTNPPKENTPCAQITLTDYIADDMDWDAVSNLLIALAEIGCVDGDINGFYWDTRPWHNSLEVPRYEASDQIIEHYKLEDSIITPPPSPLPKEQYDLKIIREWCKRNQNKYAEIRFGSRVRFNVIKEITKIFHTYDIKFALRSPNDEYGARRSIEIKLRD